MCTFLLCLLCCCISIVVYCFFFFKQKTAYEMRISDWSSDVCSSDLLKRRFVVALEVGFGTGLVLALRIQEHDLAAQLALVLLDVGLALEFDRDRSEEHTSELQSLMRISYAVFCLKKKKTHTTNITPSLLLVLTHYAS